MAFIPYLDLASIPEQDRVDDNDNILRIHSVHSALTRRHYDLFKELMFTRGPLSRTQRELLAVVVSETNGCRY